MPARRVYRTECVPSPDDYAAALLALPIAQDQKRLLQAHRSADELTASTPALSAAAGFGRHSAVNLRYGQLGHSIADFLGIRPASYDKGPLWTTAIAEGWTEPANRTWYWRLYPEVASAVNDMDWPPFD
jgi:hypothetical protein